MGEDRFSAGVKSSSLWVSRQAGSLPIRGTFSLNDA